MLLLGINGITANMSDLLCGYQNGGYQPLVDAHHRREVVAENLSAEDEEVARILGHISTARVNGPQNFFSAEQMRRKSFKVEYEL